MYVLSGFYMHESHGQKSSLLDVDDVDNVKWDSGSITNKDMTVDGKTNRFATSESQDQSK